MKPLRIIATIILLGCAAAGCDSEGRTRGPSTNVTAVHAAPTHGQIAFLREERAAASLDYRGAAAQSFEVGQYDFNVEITSLETGNPSRPLSFSETLVADTDYFFVITEDGGLLVPLIISKPVFSGTAADAEVIVVHAGPVFSAVDVYLTAPGADLSASNPIGSVSFKQNLDPQVVAVGDYQLSFTAAGNPLDVLFSSPTQTLSAGQSNLFVITDRAGEGVGDVNVSRVSAGETLVLTDVNALGNLRVVNAANDTLERDIIVSDDFANPLFGAVAYAAPTAYAPLAPGARKISVTPAGNPGVIEEEVTSTIVGGNVYTTLIAGAAGDLTATTVVEDRRPIANQGRLRLMNGAGQFAALDFFLLPVDTPISSSQPLRVNAADLTSLFAIPPGTIELTIRIPNTDTIAFGPAPLAIAGSGIYGVLAVNGTTAETADIVMLDDFN
jgi:hypothetical protein